MVESPANNKARLRRLRAQNPGWSTQKNAKWNSANPEKRRAHQIVESAVKSGALRRQGCEVCGTIVCVQTHHDDYSKPLNVVWLCRAHHCARHRELRAAISDDRVTSQ